jgi:hypothetical protein
MHSARTKGRFHIFDVALRFASTKLAAAVSRDALSRTAAMASILTPASLRTASATSTGRLMKVG